MNPYSDFLLSIAANLATDLIKAGTNRLSSMALGDEETRALAQLWEKVFENFLVALLPSSEHLIAQEIGNIFRQFINENVVADTLIDLTLTNKEPNFESLRRKFEDAGFNSAGLPLTFESTIRLLIENLNDQLNEEASHPQSQLFNRVNTTRVADVQKKIEQTLNKLDQLSDLRYITVAHNALPQLSKSLLALLELCKESCKRNNSPIYTPHLLLALLEIDSGVAQRAFNQLRPGLANEQRKKLRKFIREKLPQYNKQVFVEFDWMDREDIQQAQKIATKGGATSVTEKYLLLGMLETNSSTVKSLRKQLGEEFDDLKAIIRNLPNDEVSHYISTPGPPVF